MKRFLSAVKPGFGAAFLFLLALHAGAQEFLPGLKEQAVVLNITTRVAENQQELWNATNSKVTLPGRPVSIKLVGDNVVMDIRFTPYLRSKGPNVLIAQGQIWVNIPNEGISYKTTMKTIPLEFGEHIYFFPLGSTPVSNNPSIELLIVLKRYEDALKESLETSETAPPAEPAPVRTEE
jgi:hypothetical protein